MGYAERPPAKCLARYVRCLWSFEADEAAGPDRIVPDGRPELIVHFGSPYHEIDGRGRRRRQPAALFAGQVTRPLTVQAAGRAGVVGVRFHPDGARPLVGMPMRAATDARIALDQLWAGEGTRLAGAVAGARDREGRIGAVEEFMAERAAHADPVDDIVRACVARIEAARGEAGIDELVAAAGIGRRQLERRFAEAVGIGPALLAAILRFRSAFDLLERDATRPWTEAAIAAGYYDQSHFIREFRRFVGCTPTGFAAARGALASALVEA